MPVPQRLTGLGAGIVIAGVEGDVLEALSAALALDCESPFIIGLFSLEVVSVWGVVAFFMSD
jgi:hypothetical protein